MFKTEVEINRIIQELRLNMEGDLKLNINEKLEIETEKENAATIFDIKERIFKGFKAEDE